MPYSLKNPSGAKGSNTGNVNIQSAGSALDLRKCCSIVLQDNCLQLGDQGDADVFFPPASDLKECTESTTPTPNNQSNVDIQLKPSKKEGNSFERHPTLTCFSDTETPTGNFNKTLYNGFPHSKNTENLYGELRHRGPLHLQSADLFENFSPVQKQRCLWNPVLPRVFSAQKPIHIKEVKAPELVQYDEKSLRDLYPNIFDQECLEVVQSLTDLNAEAATPATCFSPLRVGIVLSGGPAPGGHNVISGLFDYIKRHNPESQLFGFMGGLDGLLRGKYRVVTEDLMKRFRNQGGFDMLWSGRGRINSNDDLSAAKEVCSDLAVQGLVIVGGDGSLSNAARLAEYFAEKLPSCNVIGVPKTIDGDLRNPWIATSFGFDTAAKTYSEVIGNLCTDVTTGQQVYHFVRVMGRSASHLVLECALQTRPNLVFIGEEVEAKHRTLKNIVDEIVDLIIARRKVGKLFGIVLVPEGLVEFIPEMKVLISELNALMADMKQEEGSSLSLSQISSHLTTPAAISLWKFLPESIQEQLVLDREATGYIQVARIATERLLKLLVENEFAQRNASLTEIVCMPHYFGYEGRCATPSNFDANYCYLLGYTAGCLIHSNKTGYVSVVRQLHANALDWIPTAIPITRIMHMKQNPDSSVFPAVRRQLVDLDGPLFKVFSEVRDTWKLSDCYRCPGPIQFEGPVSNIVNYTVVLPKKNDLLGGAGSSGPYSDLQKQRLLDRPELPALCKNPYARAVAASQYLPKDPFTQRQIAIYYPYLCNKNQFYLQEVIEDSTTSPIACGLRVAVVFLSRQAPGVTNVLWGIHERLKLVKGRCFGFYSKDGLFTQRYIEITDKVLEMHLNLGGMCLLGRATVHSLLTVENQEKARITCENMCLDGLIIVGSSIAMTEACMTAEYFLSKGCTTSVIGVPATGSNNLSHELIETNIGFDTSSKVYASLIGNVLTDAASMPKYWHFVRLMGRQPSNEVLECALQTHPNVVIIAEEYGAGNKTLLDVVNDIADVVVKRSNMGKNFGSVLIPDGLLLHLPNMNALMNELSALIKEAEDLHQLQDLQNQLENLEKYTIPSSNDNSTFNGKYNWLNRITPWSIALFKSLPKYIRRELTHVDMGETRFALIETELLLSQMVQEELERRRKKKLFNGKFMTVCHFFGYQGRSAMPSRFDAKLAFAFGHLAVICIESGLTGYCATIRGLCGETQEWKLGTIPFNSMLSFTASQDTTYFSNRSNDKNDVPIIPSADVNLNGKAYHWLRAAAGQWQLQDRFCNPGPLQFHGKAAEFYHRILHEEQADYFHMLRHVQVSARILRETCSFGVDEDFLKVVYANLNALLMLRFHGDDLVNCLPAFAGMLKYDARKNCVGHRPELLRPQKMTSPRLRTTDESFPNPATATTSPSSGANDFDACRSSEAKEQDVTQATVCTVNGEL